MIDKIIRSVAEALEGVKDGAVVLIAGFGGVGEPRALLDGLIEQGAKDLTLVLNAAGRDESGAGRLVALGACAQADRLVCQPCPRARGAAALSRRRA